MNARLALLLALVFVGPAWAESLDSYQPPEAGQVRIVRDRYGVPHIIARDEPSLYFGTGYVQAEDQLENLAVNYLRGQGRAAEREGLPSLIIDHFVRLLKIPSRAEQAFPQIDWQIKAQLEAFAAGVNAYISEHRNTVPAWIEPVKPHQILAFSMYVDTLFSASHCRDDLKKAGIEIAALDRLTGERGVELGSNQFAVAPQKSATGAAMLSMDPHLRHSGVYRWYEMHQVAPGLNVMGACFFGSPYVSMGRTERTAWCMTVNAPDLGDVFAFQVNADNSAQYKGPNGWEQFDQWKETYQVGGLGGTSKQTLMCQRTDLGPVVTTRDGIAYVFALSQADSPQRVRQIYDMNRATSVDEFRRALEPLGLGMYNIVYADAAGDIFYISNGRVPKRDTRIDSHDIRPGHEAWARWQGYHTVSELPQVLNPPACFLMNTNSGPPSVTRDAAPQAKDFPPYMMGQEANSRSRRLFELLDGDSSVDWDELRAYATDTQLEAAAQYAKLIVGTIRQYGDQFTGDVELLKQVADVLDAWDLRTDLESRGAVLFVSLFTNDKFITAARQQDYVAAGEAIATVAEEVNDKFGSLDVPWGQFSRIRRGDVELGVAGCGRLAITGDIETCGAALRPTSGELRDGKRICAGGSSYGMLVDFSGPTRSVSCLPFGISEVPQSPHYADQLPLYANREFKPAWFLAEELNANTESQRVLATAVQ